MEDRFEAAREVIRRMGIGDDWKAVFDPDMPAEIDQAARGLIDAYRRVDLEWLLEHADPELEITQLAELPDPHTHRGRDGLIEALLDWPRQWEDFRVTPHRIFAPDEDHFVLHATNGGRSRMMDIEVEAEIYFLMRIEDGRLTNWDMFGTLDEALSRAAERRADRHDDHAAQGDRRERA